MNKSNEINNNYKQINDIDYLIDRINNRGIIYEEKNVEDYSISIRKSETKKLVIIEIYENYFPPRRHEFEFELINQLVDFVTTYQFDSSVSAVITTTFIGNVSFNLIVYIIKHIKSKFKENNRLKYFDNIEKNTIALDEFFKCNKKATNKQIEKELRIDRDEFQPLLKLAGFKRYKHKGKKYWIAP